MGCWQCSCFPVQECSLRTTSRGCISSCFRRVYRRSRTLGMNHLRVQFESYYNWVLRITNRYSLVSSKVGRNRIYRLSVRFGGSCIYQVDKYHRFMALNKACNSCRSHHSVLLNSYCMVSFCIIFGRMRQLHLLHSPCRFRRA